MSSGKCNYVVYKKKCIIFILFSIHVQYYNNYKKYKYIYVYILILRTPDIKNNLNSEILVLT